MGSLKEVRERIKSVKSTQQITKAMKLVSASKLKRATSRINSMRPYSDKLDTVLTNILSGTDVSTMNLAYNEIRPVQRVLIVAMSSDRGLCGGFNSNLIKTTKSLIEGKYSEAYQQGKVTILPVGKKIYDFFVRYGANVNDRAYELFYHLNFEEASKVADYLMNSFLAKEFDVIEVVYSKFKNAAVQEFKIEQYLPVSTASTTTKSEETKISNYLFEPSKETMLEELVPKILKTTFFRYCLDTNASEHGARMVAMDSATNNASDLIKKLEIEYNKARQASITNQIMEIVGGAAALDA